MGGGIKTQWFLQHFFALLLARMLLFCLHAALGTTEPLFIQSRHYFNLKVCLSIHRQRLDSSPHGLLMNFFPKNINFLKILNTISKIEVTEMF